jgi:hypothetical protein
MTKFAFAFLVTPIGCAVIHGQDGTNYVPGTDFSKYRTYKWAPIVRAGQPKRIPLHGPHECGLAKKNQAAQAL